MEAVATATGREEREPFLSSVSHSSSSFSSSSSSSASPSSTTTSVASGIMSTSPTKHQTPLRARNESHGVSGEMGIRMRSSSAEEMA